MEVLLVLRLCCNCTYGKDGRGLPRNLFFFGPLLSMFCVKRTRCCCCGFCRHGDPETGSVCEVSCDSAGVVMKFHTLSGDLV